MKISLFENSCNCYLLSKDGFCLLVDCGIGMGKSLLKHLQKSGDTLLGIYLTHGHFDHIAGLNELSGVDTKVYISDEDKDFLTDPGLNGSLGFSGNPIVFNRDVLPLEEGQINDGVFSFEVIRTPFHTMGSVCFYFKEDGVLLSGDTLFHLGVGRTDLKGGSSRLMASSLAKLATLPRQTKVYPGHD